MCERRDGLWPGGAGRWERCRRAALAGLWIAASAVLPAAGALGDELELTNGRKYLGLLVERTASHVTFKAVMGSGAAELTFPARKVKSVKIDGKMPAVPKPQPRSRPAPKPRPPARTSPVQAPRPKPPPSSAGRSRADVTALIDHSGEKPPDWWDSVKLSYPKTLDLAGTHRAKGWAPDRNLGAHWFSVISPNPHRWRSGVKLLHLAAEARKKDPPRQLEAVNLLARSYLRLLKDWPRAAHWCGKAIAMAGAGRGVNPQWVTGLAECYWRLGSKPMASELLRKYGLHRAGTAAAVKLWAEMGEIKTALALAEAMSRTQQVAVGYVAAGHVCREAGKFEQALAYYNKVLALPDDGRHRRFRQVAREAAEAVRLYEALDLKRVADGQYTGSSASFRGPLRVKVVVAGGRIGSVTVTRHRDDMPFTAPTDVPRGIVARQGLKGVDTVTGATVTSEAILTAAAKALASGMK